MKNGPSPIFSFLLSSSIMYGLYALFFRYSSLIWSFYARPPIGDYVPWAKWCVPEKNGIQPYILYILMLFNLAVNVSLANIFSRINSRSVYRFLIGLFAMISFFFYKFIGFRPPMAEVGKGYPYAIFIIAIFLIMFAFSVLIIKHSKMTGYLIAALLIPICFISTREIRFYDACFIFSPALRILHGFSPHETQFLYDYFLSFFAAIWMKMQLSIYAFKIPLQISYYVLLMGIYLFAQRFFAHKLYALYLLVSLVIFKIYGNMYDPIWMLQVTPLRLDLWFIVLALVYFKGATHWLAGLMLSLLAVVHHTLGMIYAASYLLLIAVLFISEAVEQKNGINKMIRDYISSYGLNVLMLITSLFIYGIFFEPKIGNAAVIFIKGGPALPISRNSFYWYIAVMFGLTFTMIAKSKKLLPDRNFAAGIFIVLLAIGNSLYFFVRSHENNIINIAASWLLCLFLLFDLIDTRLQDLSALRTKKAIIPVFSFAVVLLFASWYSGRAVDRITHQYGNFRTGRFIHNDPAVKMDLLRRLTMFDKRVIFLSQADFYFYYRGGYVPQDYYALIYARGLKKDTVDYLNAQIVRGYYLVIPEAEYGMFAEVIDMLKFKHRKDDSGFIVLSNNPIG